MIEEAYWAVRRLNNCWTAQQAIDQAGALLCRQMLQHGERETRPDPPHDLCSQLPASKPDFTLVTHNT
jgi:hypothetical protein